MSSEVAQFREQQAAVEESARLGMSGMAAVASHETIIARMEQGATTLFELFEQGRADEAYTRWNAGILEVQ
jgi:hypothetical protein